MQLGDHVGDQSTPAGLVRRPQTAAGIAVVVFVEEEVVLEVRISLQLLITAEHRAPSGAVAPEDVDHTAAQLISDLLQRSFLAGADGAFDAKLVTVEVVE